MIEWTDKSDRQTRFFVSEDNNHSGLEVELLLKDVVAFLCTNVIGYGNAVEFGVILIEVNCDTGRLIAGVTTLENQAAGLTDGCAVRCQSLQDFWYDLDESEMSDDVFDRSIRSKVLEIGRLFREHLVLRLNDITPKASVNGFEFVVYGSIPGRVEHREFFSKVEGPID